MPRLDDVDVACLAWADAWARHFLRDPRVARDYIGPLICTLAKVHTLHDGAASTTQSSRDPPELFLGNALLVSIALQYSTLTERQIIVMHYVRRRYHPKDGRKFKRVISPPQMARMMGIRMDIYGRRLRKAKGWVRSILTGEETLAIP